MSSAHSQLMRRVGTYVYLCCKEETILGIFNRKGLKRSNYGLKRFLEKTVRVDFSLSFQLIPRISDRADQIRRNWEISSLTVNICKYSSVCRKLPPLTHFRKVEIRRIQSLLL